MFMRYLMAALFLSAVFASVGCSCCHKSRAAYAPCGCGPAVPAGPAVAVPAAPAAVSAGCPTCPAP